MSKNVDWRQFIDQNGDFELPNYLYKLIMGLMKESLDMGTLLSDDPAKLRAFKEQIKRNFKGGWAELATSLEYFDMAVRCSCDSREYCNICGGSRYILNYVLMPDQIRETGIVLEDPAIAKKLAEGHSKAMEEAEVFFGITD